MNKRLNRSGKLTAALVLCVFMTLAVLAPGVLAAETVGQVQRISILPYEGVSASSKLLSDPQSLKKGDTFAVWVTVFGVAELCGTDIQIEFSPSVLQVAIDTDSAPNPGGEGTKYRVIPGIINYVNGDSGTVNQELGRVSFAAANPESEAASCDEAVLLKVGFNVIAEGTAHVRFEERPEFTSTDGGVLLFADETQELSFTVTATSGGETDPGDTPGDNPGGSTGDTPGGSTGGPTTPADEVPIPDDPIPLGFGDVLEGDWFRDAVQFSVEHGFFKGTSESTFEPSAPMTRGMFVTVLSRIEFGSDENVPGEVSRFTDLTQDWYKNAVAWAESDGIVKGVSDSEFTPDLPITREQMAAILHRYADHKGLDIAYLDTDLDRFEDAGSVSSYAVEAVKWAVNKGLIDGMTATTLVPKNNATRAQVATIMMRFMEFLGSGD